MTPSVIEAHNRSKRFHAEIARRASLIPQKEVRTYCIPNAPFGVPKVQIVYVLPDPREWLHCMWFWNLVNYVPEPPTIINVKRIQNITAAFYGVSKLDLISIRRTAVVVRPRQVAMFLAKSMTLCSLPEIGRRFGMRDHTTILHAVRKIEALEKTDPKLAEEIRQIKMEIAA